MLRILLKSVFSPFYKVIKKYFLLDRKINKVVLFTLGTEKSR